MRLQNVKKLGKLETHANLIRGKYNPKQREEVNKQHRKQTSYQRRTFPCGIFQVLLAKFR